MPVLTLPDGSVRTFEQSLTVLELAFSISAGLARVALAGRVNGQLVDLSHLITDDAEVVILTDRDQSSLDVVRHSTAHLLAHAVKDLFPDAQVTIGPVIEDGFFYDFSYHRPFTPDDLTQIEQRMQALSKQDIAIERRDVSRDEAIAFFRERGELYKSELIAAIPSGDVISLYAQGEFVDLCRGPHVPSTGRLKTFKLMKLAGAYWRGDSKNEMLQRVYGTAWFKKEDLQAYLHRIEEAEKRDHRKLGRQLDLFHLQEEAPGMVFWHPKGWTVWQVIEQYLRALLSSVGYQEIRTPQVMDRSLWERSGHWEHYRDNMFVTESEKHDYAVKPMNCPGHVQVFNHALRSYRDLPLRLAEFGACHRNEPSGALHGLMRVRGFTQDDAHIFCTEAQIIDEARAFNHLVTQVYRDFGFESVDVKLALRPAKFAGDPALWLRAEAGLRTALSACGLTWQELPGEGAFYGPKIEYHIKDALGRSWQCGTLQLDFVLPERLEAEYVAEDNSRQRPVMLHRAILGSMERFVGILIENFAGNFPFWLAPVQVVVANVSQAQTDYVESVFRQLLDAGIRVVADLRNEKITYKIREHSMQKLPYIIIVGDKEKEANTVSVRVRGGEDLGTMSVADLLVRFHQESASRR